jgi:hypothetical protein
MSEKRFPIKDVQFHEEGIREASKNATLDEIAAIAWHTSAINFLECGVRHDLPGPAAEFPAFPGVDVVMVEDYLIRAADSHGFPYFQPVVKTVAKAAG